MRLKLERPWPDTRPMIRRWPCRLSRLGSLRPAARHLPPAGLADCGLPCSSPPPGPCRNLRGTQHLRPQLLALAGLQPAIDAAGVAGSGLPCSAAARAAAPRRLAGLATFRRRPAAATAAVGTDRPAAGDRRRRRCRQPSALQLAKAARAAAPRRLAGLATFGRMPAAAAAAVGTGRPAAGDRRRRHCRQPSALQRGQGRRAAAPRRLARLATFE
ncbi:hypothetical protein ACVKU6_004176 [Stenotrophomonas sp. PvP086]